MFNNILIEHYVSLINFPKVENVLNICLFEIILFEIFLYKIFTKHGNSRLYQHKLKTASGDSIHFLLTVLTVIFIPWKHILTERASGCDPVQDLNWGLDDHLLHCKVYIGKSYQCWLAVYEEHKLYTWYNLICYTAHIHMHVKHTYTQVTVYLSESKGSIPQWMWRQNSLRYRGQSVFINMEVLFALIIYTHNRQPTNHLAYCCLLKASSSTTCTSKGTCNHESKLGVAGA